ncbi:MAG TPA: universal stress protein [Sedimentisphaerales bacterium]|nr:universal stress protein [Sedimentisphaerales bacterium]
MEHNELLPTTCQRILFCTDLSENSDFAFSFAVDAAIRRPDCELFLLHVVPETESQFWKSYIYEVEGVDNKAKHDIDLKIEQNYTSKLPAGLKMQIEFRIGKDYQVILDFANEKNVDMIVMGRQGRGAFQKALFGNVTEKVVRKADCTVLVVPLSYEKRLLNKSK